MPSTIVDGLALVDFTGRLILGMIVTTLVLGVGVNVWVRRRYAGLQRDLDDNGPPDPRFAHEVLNRIVRDARDAARRTAEPNVQAIVEEHFQSGLRSLLLGERFVRAATGLVIILGLLGTFYGLTSSIGKLVHLVSGDPGAIADVTQAVTNGLSNALSGMAVAFSNSLFGVFSAVVLTVFGVVSNLTDRRTDLMVRIETYLDRLITTDSGNRKIANGHSSAAFDAAVSRLETAVGRFESALLAFSSSTRDFSEFNAHLKDNVQRMSLSFGDLNDALKGHVVALRRENGR